MLNDHYADISTDTEYRVRSRSHTKELIQKTPNLNNSHFLIRLLYKDCY